MCYSLLKKVVALRYRVTQQRTGRISGYNNSAIAATLEAITIIVLGLFLFHYFPDFFQLQTNV